MTLTLMLLTIVVVVVVVVVMMSMMKAWREASLPRWPAPPSLEKGRERLEARMPALPLKLFAVTRSWNQKN